MNDRKAQALIATCIDFRLQDDIDNWISKNFEPETFDRVSIAGDVKDLQEVLDQIKIAHNLHHIKKVVLINHEDCGAYNSEGTYERHIHDLRNAENKIEQLYPDLVVDIYYLHLDGEFEKIEPN